MDIEPGNYEYGIVTWSQDTEDQELGDWQGDPLNPKHSEMVILLLMHYLQ